MYQFGGQTKQGLNLCSFTSCMRLGELSSPPTNVTPQIHHVTPDYSSTRLHARESTKQKQKIPQAVSPLTFCVFAGPLSCLSPPGYCQFLIKGIMYSWPWYLTHGTFPGDAEIISLRKTTCSDNQGSLALTGLCVQWLAPSDFRDDLS